MKHEIGAVDKVLPFIEVLLLVVMFPKVAFSRSKRKTIIVGDQNTLIKSKFLSRSIDTVTKKEGFFIWRN